MRPKVYVETTIPSYLTAWPSRDLIRAAHQQVTREWWAKRHAFDLFASQLVLDECQRGDSQASAERLRLLQDVMLLDDDPKAGELTAGARSGSKTAAEGDRGRLSHCDFRAQWNRLPGDMELPAYRQRGPAANDSERLPVRRL